MSAFLEAPVRELPAGWVRTTVGEIATTSSGGTPSSKNPAYYGGQIPWVKIGDLTDSDVLVTEQKITEAGLNASSAKLLRPGTLLLAMYGSIGKLGVLRMEAATNQAICALVPTESVVPEYLFWFLRSQRTLLMDMGRGGTQLNIGQGDIKRLVIPVPPLEEQERIVEIVEELTTQIDGGERQLQSAVDAAAKYRAAVLHHAFRGFDTEPLAQSCEFVTDGDHNPPKRQPSGIPHLTAKNVRDGTLDLSNVTYIDSVDFERVRKRYEPQAGDVIVTCVGTIGRIGIVPDGVVFSPDRNLAGLRCLPSVMPDFLAAALNTPSLQQLMSEASGSTAQPHLYLGDLRSLPVPIASPAEQRAVIQALGSKLAAVDGLRDTVRAQQRQAERLKQALLRDALVGKLTQQVCA